MTDGEKQAMIFYFISLALMFLGIGIVFDHDPKVFEDLGGRKHFIIKDHPVEERTIRVDGIYGNEFN